MTKYIDPPEGWRYGFPKAYSSNETWPDNLTEWIIANGYPRKVVESYGQHFYVRMWETEEK